MSDIYYYTSYSIAFISAVLYTVMYMKGTLPKKYKYFVFFLISLFSLDFIGNILYEIQDFIEGYEGENLPVYALLTLLEFNFLFLFYKRLSEDKITKKVIWFNTWVFNSIFVISTLYYLYNDFFLKEYNSIASISGGILIAIVFFMFLREFLISNKILNYKKDLTFWITFGLLFYYLASIPVSLFLNYSDFDSVEAGAAAANNHALIHFYLGLFMHSCFMFGLFWSQKKEE